jgi:nitroreductase
VSRPLTTPARRAVATTDMADTPNSAAEALARLNVPLLEAMMTQRAVRRVRPDPVDDAIVLKCIELALRAPTGSNGQNWEFIVVKDRRIKEKLGARYRQGWSVYGGIGERITAGDESMAKILRAVQWQSTTSARSRSSSWPACVPGVREGRVPYLPAPYVLAATFFGSIYPSVQNLLLAARAMGLGASLITLPLWSVTSARRILGPPLSVTPCCIVPMGWPQGRYGPTTRRPVEEVTHLDAYGNRAWLDAP